MPTIFEKYPYINSLRSLVPDELIEAEIGSKADDFLVRATPQISGSNIIIKAAKDLI